MSMYCCVGIAPLGQNRFQPSTTSKVDARVIDETVVHSKRQCFEMDPAFSAPPSAAQLAKVGAARTALPAHGTRCRSTRSPRMQTGSPASRGRVAWPFARFLKTALWFSPLGTTLAGRPKMPDALKDPSSLAGSAVTSTPTKREDVSVLVVGASGGSGARVVRELLKDGSTVRAMVRNMSSGTKALKDIGVDPEQYPGKLEIVEGDLLNLRPEVLEGVNAVICAAGVRLGPAPKSPDGEASNGPPLVTDSPPQTVEYQGVKALVDMASRSLQQATQKSDRMAGTTPMISFSDPEMVNAVWAPLDDIVMGGVSESSITVIDDQLVFAGIISTDNSGGFASVRSIDLPAPLDMSNCEGVRFRVKGDGKRYKFILRCDSKWDGIAYCHSFDTVAGRWIDVEVPFATMIQNFRSTTVSDRPLDTSKITAVQIMLSKFEYDGELNPQFSAGDFELRVDNIYGYRKAAAEEPSILQSRFVHLSTAGITRVLRRDEFDVDNLPPAVKLNDQLGRLLEWKLAGEDAVRSSASKLGYVIVRPCALTMDEPVGQGDLLYFQGDNVTGKISRDDIARVLVEALYSKDTVNTSFEVVSSGKFDDTAALQPNDLVNDLNAPTRTFASFPFTPQ